MGRAQRHLMFDARDSRFNALFGPSRGGGGDADARSALADEDEVLGAWLAGGNATSEHLRAVAVEVDGPRVSRLATTEPCKFSYLLADGQIVGRRLARPGWRTHITVRHKLGGTLGGDLQLKLELTLAANKDATVGFTDDSAAAMTKKFAASAFERAGLVAAGLAESDDLLATLSLSARQAEMLHRLAVVGPSDLETELPEMMGDGHRADKTNATFNQLADRGLVRAVAYPKIELTEDGDTLVRARNLENPSGG